MIRSSLTLLFLIWAVALTAGCNDTHVTFTGNVTSSGQPLPKGQIEFAPADGAGTPVGVPIVAGKYTARMLPGEKIVVVTESFDIPVPKSTEEMQRAAAEGKSQASAPVSKIKRNTKGNSTKVNVTKETKTLDFPLEP